MTAARHMIALLRSHIDGDDEQFLSVAMQVAAHEARQGHGKLAKSLKDLVDSARQRHVRQTNNPIPLVQPRGDLASLVSAVYSDIRLSTMVLPEDIEKRLKRIITEHRQKHRLAKMGLGPRRKILLVGPPGSGKTMTASALAGELKIPQFTAVLDSIITRFMGETASKLRVIFDAMADTKGVYFFDEFDAIGAHRGQQNDVGEIRRVLNSFLQFLESDNSDGLVIAATNHPELLDIALFRRFDDVIEYNLPNKSDAKCIIKNRLSVINTTNIDFDIIISNVSGLSHAELSCAAEDAIKRALLSDRNEVTHEDIEVAIEERKFLSSHRRLI